MRIMPICLALLLGVLFGQSSAISADAKLTVVGTGDGLEMLQEIGSGFSEAYPGIELSIPPSIGSGGGIAAVSSGAERMGRVARPLKESEVEFGLVYLPIAKIPSSIFTHPSTGVSELTSEQLIKIYEGKITNWSEVGGADLRVRVIRREESDSTLQVLRATMPGWTDMEFSPRSKTALTTQDAISSAREVEGAIAFGPYSRPLEEGLDVLKIDGHHPMDEGYPSAVVLALVYKDGTMDEQMKTFIEFAQSDRAQEMIRNYGGVPVSQ